VAVTAALGGCGSKAGGGIVPEQVAPQISAPAPAALPPPSALRGASYTQQDLYHLGIEYDDSLPYNLVSREGEDAVFAPQWIQPVGQFEELAYATYQFQLNEVVPDPQVHFTWNKTDNYTDGWVALANFQRDRWDWYELPQSGELPYNPAKNVSATGAMYVVVLFTGEAEWLLHEIWISLGNPSGAWPMFGHDVRHTHKSAYIGSQTGKLKWKFRTTSAGFDFKDALVGPDGTIYVGSNYLYAINPDGSLKWSFATGSWVESSPAIGADGTVYVGSADGKLYAFGD
jgi:hypothetical protein